MRIALITSLLLISGIAQAQKKTTFYPNGNKEFEGEYKMGYNVADTRDLYNFDTAKDKRRTGSLNMTFRTMERDAPPQKIFNGKCTFYYDNGKTSYTGTYNNGLKNGAFSYSYISGEKEAEYNYVNGMADGKWQAWYPNGKPRMEQNYAAFTDAELDTIYTHKVSGGNPFMGNPVMAERNKLRNFGNDSMRKLPGNTFSKFAELENSFYKNAHWNGVFYSYYPNGNKCTEMHYKNDVRVGKWYYWNDAGAESVTLTYADGKIMDASNNLPAAPEQNRMPANMMPPDREAMKRASYRDSLRTRQLPARPEMPAPGTPPVKK